MYLHFLETPLKPNFNYIFNKWQNSGWSHAVHQRTDNSGVFFIIIFLLQTLLCFLASISWICSSRERRFALLTALNPSGPSEIPFVFIRCFIQPFPSSFLSRKAKAIDFCKKPWVILQEESDNQMWTWSSKPSPSHYSFKISISSWVGKKRTLSNYKGHNTFMDLLECTWKTAAVLKLWSKR